MIDRIIRSLILCSGFLASCTVVFNVEQFEALSQKTIISYHAGDYSKAIIWAEEALNYTTGHLGNDHPKTLISMNNLAFMYKSLGRYDEAELLFIKTVKLKNEVLGEKHPSTLISINNLGRLYYSKRRYDKAEPIYLKALALSNEVLGDTHPDTLTSMSNLAELYRSQGRYDEAEPIYLKALALSNEVLGDTHPDTLISLNNLALLYISQGRYDEAEPLLLNNLEFRTEVLGGRRPDTLTSLGNLAKMYLHQGRYEKAEPLLKKDMELRVEVFGEIHPHILSSMGNLANLYKFQGRYDEAEPLYLNALVLSNAVLGERHPNTLKSMGNLAGLFDAQGRFDKAEPLYLNTLRLSTEILGEKHPDTLISLSNLAHLYYSQGRYDKAEPLLLYELELSTDVFGEKHPETVVSINNLALLYNSQDRYDEAEPLYINALELSKEVLGERHPNTLKSMGNLADGYKSQGRYDEAEQLYLNTLRLSTEILGEKHPDTLISLNNLAHLYYFQGRYDEAEPLYLKTLALSKEVLGETHPSTLISMNNLASLYYIQGSYFEVEYYFDRELPATQQFLTQMLWAAGAATQESYIHQYNINTDLYLSVFSLHNTDANARRALSLSLNRKALLLQIATQIRALERSNENPTLSELAISLKTKRQHLSNLYLKGNPKGVDIHTLEETINQQQAELGRHVQKLSLDRTVITPNQVIDALDEQSVFIDYMIYQAIAPDEKTYQGAHLLALVVSNDQKQSVRLVPLGEMAPIEQAIMQYRKLLGQSQTLTADGVSIAQQLYQSLLEPLLPSIKQRRQVYIALDGILNLLPFASLIDSERRYLIDQYQVMMLSSGRDLVVPPLLADVKDPVVFAAPLYDPEQAEQYPDSEDIRRATTTARDKVSLYFDPLPGTLQEGEALIRVLEDNKQTASYYKLETATEQNLVSIESPSILHIATHGYFLEDVPNIVENNPLQPSGQLFLASEKPSLSNVMPRIENPLLRAGLALVDANLVINADNEVEYGILTALEVLDLQLAGTELVVLSACDTGIGEIRTGEGIYGLRRAFQEAGARYVLSTLWSISDSGTQEFMIRFYKRYLAGTPPQQALRDTQFEFIQSKRWSHPYYWAAFVIMGK